MKDFNFSLRKIDEGKRIDAVVSEYLETISRSLVSNLFRQGRIQVNGSPRKPGYKAKAGDEITGEIPPPEPMICLPEPIPLTILFEDEHIIVIDKQAGLVVHPAAGHHSGTLVNGILFHCPELEGIGGRVRPGIVHRLDKDTSGCIVIAKTGSAHRNLADQFRDRRIRKIYLALIRGIPADDSGTIMEPIGRHPTERKKMSIHSRSSREAETRWRIRERFMGISLVEVEIKTGRTHQIRVHMAAMGHPVLGDSLYGSRKQRANPDPSLKGLTGRQMLHAHQLYLAHPADGKDMSFTAPIAQDMALIIQRLREKNEE